MAGKSTLNQLSRDAPTKYRRIPHEASAIEGLFVDLFLEAHAKAPRQITLDLDATDDPPHGDQEGRFFHAYYDATAKVASAYPYSPVVKNFRGY